MSIHIVEEYDLINEIWEDRPALPNGLVFEHEVKYSGKTRYSKLTKLRKKMEEYGCNYHFIGSLDDIAWIFNIRGNDVNFNPVVVSYALIGLDQAVLYISPDKLDDTLTAKLKEQGVTLKSYSEMMRLLHQAHHETRISNMPCVKKISRVSPDCFEVLLKFLLS